MTASREIPLPLDGQAGLYLHIPFCQSKCPYCDFFSVTETDLLEPWLEAVQAELRLCLRRRDIGPAQGVAMGLASPEAEPTPTAGVDSLWGPFSTCYLGGGSPSLLPEGIMRRLLTDLHRVVPLTPGAEITLEANPDDITLDKLRCWQELGVTRLSMGVQSLVEGELRFLGRRHGAQQARRALDWARQTGFAALSVDLIYALPGQTQDQWLQNLEAILAYQPEHLSLYQLTATPNTPLGQKVRRGAVTLPNGETQRRLFLFTSHFLTAAGYDHYEVSNFARTPADLARHNSKYWLHVPYLGVGPAAHTFNGRSRRWNVRSVAAYCQLLARGQSPVGGSEVLSPEQLLLEKLALGLRTRWGVALTELAHFPQAQQVLPELCRAGLLQVQGERVCPTPEGFVVADGLAALLSC